MADNASEQDAYDVGYRKPPLATRFQKGVSGNPRGRPKGARNLSTVVAAALNEKVLITENGWKSPNAAEYDGQTFKTFQEANAVTENGRKRRISKFEAAVKQLVNRAAGGEARATQLLLGLIQAGEARAVEAPVPGFEDGDEDALRELMRRIGQGRSP